MRKILLPRFVKWAILFCLVGLIMIPLLARRANAATFASYYVSPTGSDSNPGTLAAPFQTIARARDVVRTVNSGMSGDIYVYLRGGTYNITSPIAFGPQDSGNNGYRVFYQAYPGETPVLSGSVKVTGWSQYSGNIYRASLNRSTKLRYLYVNDQRALMTSKTVTARGGYGTYSVTAGQASWAWVSGSKSDGIQYNTGDVPAIASNRDDLEVVTASTWNENIATARDVITSGSYRVLLLQQPSGAIAQLPGWGAALVLSGSNTLYNAFEFLNGPGQFYFDKTNRWLYYYPRSGENMATADVQAPVAEQLITITGSSRTNRVKNLTFQGITFANTDYNLFNIGNSRGKATVQAASAFIAFGDGNQHNSKYQIMDTLPGAITVNNADGIQFLGNVVKHSGNEGISLINDVVNSSVVGNAILDIAGSGITVGHPQHVYLDDGGTHEKYAPGVEGIATNNTVSNNLIYNASAAPGFGGHAAITAYFVDTLRITNNQIQNTAYNGISLGWGWRNFQDSTTCKNNTVNNNRLINTMSRLHDSGAIYTIGQMATTNINQNYVRGIPSNAGGPTYGLHNDEGSAYIIENDSVLDIDPGVTYTINAEDFGEKHDLTIRRTYATVNKMGVTPPNSVIDPPIVVSDAVWPVAQYNIALNSGIQDAYRSIIPASVLAVQDYVFPASVAVNSGTLLNIRSSGDAANSVWFAPAGTTNFAEGSTMTRAAGTATSIYAPGTAGTYKLFVLNAQGVKLGESVARLRTSGTVSCTTVPPAPSNLQATAASSSQINLSWSTVSAPPGCSVTYSVFRNNSQVASNITGGSFSDSGLAPSTSYQYFVRAVDAAGSSANSNTASATTQAGDGSIAINAGGSGTGSFIADAYFSGGSTYTNTATIDMSQITANPPPAAVFNTERYGAMTYTIPNRSGAQTVTLYFAETYVTAAGQRLFNVSINGATVLSNFDIFASAGGANRAIARTFNTTANSSGQVVIQFSVVTENPKINGISVTSGSTTTPPPTTPPPTTPAGQAPYGGTPAAIPGTIQAENYDTGGEGVAYHDTTSGNSGNTYRTDGVDVETTTDSGGGYDVGYTEAGEWQEYTVNVAASGTYTLNARVASQSGGGTLHVEVDGVNVTGALTIPSTGGWQTWTTVTRTGISLSAGQHVLRIAEDLAGFNINWVSFTGGGTPPVTTPPPTTPPPTTPPPTTPPPTTPAPETYTLIARHSGKLMDVLNQSLADAATIVQMPGNGGTSQRWRFVDVGGGYYNLVNQNSGKCLDVNGASTADGASVIQWTCGSGTNQQWQWVASGSYYQLRARHSGKCLDVNQASTADGASVIQWTCGSGTNQQWTRQ